MKSNGRKSVTSKPENTGHYWKINTGDRVVRMREFMSSRKTISSSWIWLRQKCLRTELMMGPCDDNNAYLLGGRLSWRVSCGYFHPLRANCVTIHKANTRSLPFRSVLAHYSHTITVKITQTQLYLAKHHAMKTYWEVELWSHLFQILSPNGDERSDSSPRYYTPR